MQCKDFGRGGGSVIIGLYKGWIDKRTMLLDQTGENNVSLLYQFCRSSSGRAV